MDERKFDEAIDLGAWLGRKQAFSGMAGRCSAADAHCLRSMKDEQKYKTFGLTWMSLLTALGISRSLADKTIRLFEEFGETYFYLTGLIPIAPEDYRRIAGSVTADGLRHGGETIAIVPQNAPKLAAAVQDLKRQTQLALPAPGSRPRPPCARPPAGCNPRLGSWSNCSPMTLATTTGRADGLAGWRRRAPLPAALQPPAVGRTRWSARDATSRSSPQDRSPVTDKRPARGRPRTRGSAPQAAPCYRDSAVPD